MLYRGYEVSLRSIVGGRNISKDGDFVDHVLGNDADACYAIDQIIAESVNYDATLPVEPVTMVEVREDDLCLLISIARRYRREESAKGVYENGESRDETIGRTTIAINRSHEARMEALR